LTLAELWREAEAVLFDFDGVIADSEPLYRDTWNSVLADFGCFVSEESYWKHWSYLGEGLEGEIRRKGLIITDPQREKNRQRALYRSRCLSDGIDLFPGAAETLSLVMNRKPCAIASNTEGYLVKEILGRHLELLPPVTGGEGLKPKPAPDIFLKAAEYLNVHPSRCLVIEDAMKGITAGLSAGMPVILVRNRYNWNLNGTGAAVEVNGMNELLSCLEKL